ncbi:hypothetical protein PFISCL1PPCAC_26959, partial [Pristionchus fissidentatus]
LSISSLLPAFFAMRLLLFFTFCCIIAEIAPQKIEYASLFCTAIGISQSGPEWIAKYKTMVDNLNKDKTLAAQITRATNFVKNNFKNLKSIPSKDDVPMMVSQVKMKLESRWRMVTYLKGLLAKIKPNLGAAKFEEIKKLLWAEDKKTVNSMYYTYPNWKTAMMKALPDAKKSKINTIINNNESKYTAFSDDQWTWFPGMGFSGCGM